MEMSTPLSWRTKKEGSPESIPGITPIKPPTYSPDLVPPELSDFEDVASEIIDKGRTNNSNELRGYLITPRRIETEDEENIRLVKETEMLARSSTGTQCMVEMEASNIPDPLQKNYFFGSGYMRERSRSLDSLFADIDLN